MEVSVFICAIILGLVLVYLKWIQKFLTRVKREIRLIYRFVSAGLRFFYSEKLNRTVQDEFTRIAQKYPNKVAIFFEDEKWTFAEMELLVNQVANYFSQQGFVKGDKIGILMENRAEYICIWLGLAKLGVISALINTNLRSSSLNHCLKAGKCTSIIYGSELAGALKDLSEQGLLEMQSLYEFKGNEDQIILPDAKDLRQALQNSSSKPPIIKEQINYTDELLYIYTSGTTGLPKAAIIKHSRFIIIGLGAKYLGNFKKEDVVYVSVPLYHVAGTIAGIGQGIMNGSSIVIVKKFSASRFWNDCRKYNVTVVQYIGEICRFLLAQPPNALDKVHSVSKIFGNGLRAEIWGDFVKRFNIKDVTEFYASTEGNCGLVNVDNKIGAVGCIPSILSRFVDMSLVKVDKETGEPIRDPVTGHCIKCGPNEEGELVGMIMVGNSFTDFEGYTDKASKSKKVISNVFKKGDKAFRSGDILVRDEEGYYFFKDRQGDTFRWKGENVSTTEVEGIVSKVCGLVGAAVYGVEIPGNDGKAGMAAIVDPEDKLDLIALASQLAHELPPYARPLFIRKLKQMDMTGTFKLKKVDLQKDGFDLTKVKDPIYFFTNGAFTPLDTELYTKIIGRQIRV